MKKVIVLLCTIFIMFIISSCNKNTEMISQNQKFNINKEVYLDIITTNKSIYDGVKDIVKNKHYVEYLFKNKNDINSFEYSKDFIENINKKDLYFYIGADYEPWIEDVSDKITKEKVVFVNLSRGVKIIPNTKAQKVKNKVIIYNSNYLLNLNNYKIMLSNIKNAIQDKDPRNRQFYEKNFSDNLKEIEECDDEFEKISSKLQQYHFIVDEDELDYFNKYLNLNVFKINRSKNGEILNKDELLSYIKQYKDKCVLLYVKKDILKNNKDIINEFKVLSLNLKAYDENMHYKDIIKYNLKALQSL